MAVFLEFVVPVLGPLSLNGFIMMHISSVWHCIIISLQCQFALTSPLMFELRHTLNSYCGCIAEPCNKKNITKLHCRQLALYSAII